MSTNYLICPNRPSIVEETRKQIEAYINSLHPQVPKTELIAQAIPYLEKLRDTTLSRSERDHLCALIKELR